MNKIPLADANASIAVGMNQDLGSPTSYLTQKGGPAKSKSNTHVWLGGGVILDA